MPRSLNRLRQAYADYRRRRALRTIRASIVMFGEQLDYLTDEEIEAAMARASAKPC